MKKRIGEHPDFNAVYTDKNMTLYRINDESTSKDRKPIIIFNGNVSSDYNPNNYGKAKVSSIAILSDRFFGNSYDWYDMDTQQAYVMSINGKPVHANTSIEYAQSLLTAQKELKLQKADLVGKSYGGIIALQTLNQDQLDYVDHVYGCNMPLYGSPLADYTNLKIFIQNNKQHPLDYMIAKASLAVIDPTFGSTKENALGINLETLQLPKDLTKFTAISSLAFVKDQNGEEQYTTKGGIGKVVEQLGARFIKKHYNKLSDGVVIVDQERMNKDGIDYHIIPNSYHSDMSNQEHLEKCYQYIKTK